MGGCCCCGGSKEAPPETNAASGNASKGAFADFLESEKDNGGHNPRRSQLGGTGNGGTGMPQKGYQPLAVHKRESDVSSAEPTTDSGGAVELQSRTADSTGATTSEIISDSPALSANNLSVEVVVTSDTHTDTTIAKSKRGGKKSRQLRTQSAEPPGIRRARTFDADSPANSPVPSKAEKQHHPRSSMRLTDKSPSKKPRASMVVIDASDWQQKATAKNLLKYQKFLKKQQKSGSKKRYQYADADSFFASATAEAEAKMTSAERQKLNKSRNLDSTLEELHSDGTSKKKKKKGDDDEKGEDETSSQDEEEEEEESEDEEEEEEEESSSESEEEVDSSEERWYAQFKAERLRKKAAKQKAEAEAKAAKQRADAAVTNKFGSSRTLLTVTRPAEEVKSESDIDSVMSASPMRGSSATSASSGDDTTADEGNDSGDDEKAKMERRRKEVRDLKERIKQKRGTSKSPRLSGMSGDFFGVSGSASSLLSDEDRRQLKEERRRQRKIREDDMAARMKLYKIEHKKRLREQQRLERKRLMESVPPKPSISEYEFKEKTQKTLLYISQKFDVGTTFTGMCDFVDKGELPLELHITSQVNMEENGSFTGESVDFTKWDGSSHRIKGSGLLKCDLVWNATKEKYEECVLFKWTQESEGVVYEMEFNTFDFECDLKHLYFEGICVRYPLLVSKKDDPDKWSQIAHCGTFDFVCASRRNHHSTGTSGASRIIHLREIIGREAFDELINQEMMADSDPKWMRRASAYQESIERTKSAARSSFMAVPGTPTSGTVKSVTSRADSIGRGRSGSATAARSSLTPSPGPSLADDASSKLFGKRWSIQPGAQADTSAIAKLRAEIGTGDGTLRDLDPLLTQFASTPTRDTMDSDKD